MTRPFMNWKISFMVEVLGFREVRQRLLDRGFKHEGGRDDDKAVRFVHSRSKDPVFLKLSKALNPTTREWLVVHPRHDGALPSLSGMFRSEKGFAHSSAYVDFPTRKHKGEGETPYGLDLSFESLRHLDALLDFLLGASKTEPPPTAEQDIAAATDLPTAETEREAVVAARRGQGRFRKSLELLWTACAVTGCKNRALLRASHIKPWRNSDNHDRLYPYNGLLLAAHLDAAFDAGLISFSDDGRLLMHSSRLSAADASALGIDPTMGLREVHPFHKPFLAEHRRLHQFEV